MLEVRFWTDVFEKRGAILDAWRDGRLNSGFLIREMDGLPPGFTPKHLHGFFMAAFSIVTGLRDEWSGALWAAVTGTLTIAIVGLWTARYFSAGTAILAALLCAISRAHVMYSRSQLAEADAIFFMTAAVLLHAALALRFRRDAPIGATALSGALLFGVGLAYGVAIGVNYRCVLILPLVFLWDFVSCRRSLPRAAILVAGMIVPLALIELPYRIYIWRGGDLPEGIQTYFQGFWTRLFLDVPAGENPVGAMFRLHAGMFQSYIYLDWLWWAGGMALGLWATVRTRCPVRRLVCLLAWVPLMGFSLVTRGDGPRAVMTSIPFFAIVSAFGWMEYAAWFNSMIVPDWARKSVAGLISALVALGAFSAWQEPRVSSAWPAAGRWLAGQEASATVYATNPMAVRYYLGKNRAELVPSGDTAPAVAPGLWVIDRYQATYSYPYASVRKLMESHRPDQVFEGRVYPSTGLFLDWGYFMRSGNWRVELKRKGMGRIEVYDVR